MHNVDTVNVNVDSLLVFVGSLLANVDTLNVNVVWQLWAMVPYNYYLYCECKTNFTTAQNI